MTSRSKPAERREQPAKGDENHLPLCGCESAKGCTFQQCPHKGKPT
jgi:hypothetical protein